MRVALEAMPAIYDDLAADILIQTLTTIADLEQELRAVRATLSAALTLTSTQATELRRLRARLTDLYALRRSELGRV